MPEIGSKTETVKVVVRCRPPNDGQKTHKIVVNVDEQARMITVDNPNSEKTSQPSTRDFTFDSTFGPKCRQQSVFADTALPIIESVLQGYNGTIFAYGQTGTGKTFTMQGVVQEPNLMGIVPRAIRYIFKAIEGAATTKKYLVQTSFLELYNEHLIDLLDYPLKGKQMKQLSIHQVPNVGIKVSNLSEHMITNEKQTLHKYNMGKSHRTVAQTKMNAESSRSHSIFTIIIENQQQINGKMMIRAGKLNLVDLAGSQRQSKTGVTGIERQQAININLSLTTLGLVIQNLVYAKSTHIPYRDSKLTRLLQDSLGGNTKTVMIANVGPASYNYEETLSTLKYANRAKSIKNDVRINQDPKDALLRKFQEEIKKLKEQVALNINGQAVSYPMERVVEEDDVEQFQDRLRAENQAMRKKFDGQKAQIHKKKNMLEQEKSKLISEIEQKQKQQIHFKQNQQALIKKLKKMQNKVLSGKQQQQAALNKAQILHKQMKEIEQKRQKQRRIESNLKQKQDSLDSMNKMYKSLQQQTQDKTQQIKLKLKRLKNRQNQNKQLDDMYAEQIKNLRQRRRMLQKQLKLKNVIIQYFVPQHYIDTIKSKRIWNEIKQQWVLPNLNISGNKLKQQKIEDIQPITQEELQQNKLNEMAKIQLDNHPNVYYTYTEDGIVQEFHRTEGTKKTKKKTNKKTK